MADAYVGEIRIFAGNFAPNGWAFCNGQSLYVQQYTALFAVIGITYGGDGQTTFNLPNLQDMVPVGMGEGPGLTSRELGQPINGSATVTLSSSNLASHTHATQAVAQVGNTTDPTNAFWAESPLTGSKVKVQDKLYVAPPVNTNMNPILVQSTGQGMPHNNMQPYLPMNFIICLEGLFPSKQQ